MTESAEKRSDIIGRFLMSAGNRPGEGLANLYAYAQRILHVWMDFEDPVIRLLKPERIGSRGENGTKIFLVLAGQHRLWTDDREMLTSPGEIGCVFPRQSNREDWIVDQRGRYLHIFLCSRPRGISANLAGVFPGLPRERGVYGQGVRPFVDVMLLERFLSFLALFDESPPDIRRAFGTLLIQGLNQVDTFRGSRLIRDALSAIDWDSCDPDLSVKTLASSLGCHPDYLSRRFKEETGQSLMTYVFERRMEVAANLLSVQGQNVADVAALCGYHDHSYFSRRFRERYQTTPFEYAARESAFVKN